MYSLEEIMKELESLGSEQTRTVLMRHGARDPFFGVKVADLKKIQKRIKTNHDLALQLYNTGNSDAMYLAGMIADSSQMDPKTLQKWAEQAYWYMISDHALAGVAAESNYGWQMAEKWINSRQEFIESAGWATYTALLSIKPDNEIDTKSIKNLLERVGNEIHHAKNRVRYTMNGFVIGAGAFVTSLKEEALEVANRIGKVDVFMGKTSCKVPLANEYINKVYAKGYGGKKRKSALC